MGFHDLPRLSSTICETKQKVGSQMWCQIFLNPHGTCRSLRRVLQNAGVGAQMPEKQRFFSACTEARPKNLKPHFGVNF